MIEDATGYIQVPGVLTTKLLIRPVASCFLQETRQRGVPHPQVRHGLSTWHGSAPGGADSSVAGVSCRKRETSGLTSKLVVNSTAMRRHHATAPGGADSSTRNSLLVEHKEYRGFLFSRWVWCVCVNKPVQGGIPPSRLTADFSYQPGT